MGPQAVVGSICPAQLGKPADHDYGYRPAFAAAIEAMKSAL
jgi:hypothetical protein